MSWSQITWWRYLRLLTITPASLRKSLQFFRTFMIWMTYLNSPLSLLLSTSDEFIHVLQRSWLTCNRWSEDPEEVGSSVSRWLHHTVRGSTSDDLIIHIATRSISRRLIIQLCLWEVYILLRDRLLDVSCHIARMSFSENLRLFVSEFISHLYPLLVKVFSLTDYVRYRSSLNLRCMNRSREKRTGPSFEVSVFYERFWDSLGQLIVSSSVATKESCCRHTESLKEVIK